MSDKITYLLLFILGAGALVFWAYCIYLFLILSHS